MTFLVKIRTPGSSFNCFKWHSLSKPKALHFFFLTVSSGVPCQNKHANCFKWHFLSSHQIAAGKMHVWVTDAKCLLLALHITDLRLHSFNGAYVPGNLYNGVHNCVLSSKLLRWTVTKHIQMPSQSMLPFLTKIVSYPKASLPAAMPTVLPAAMPMPTVLLY